MLSLLSFSPDTRNNQSQLSCKAGLLNPYITPRNHTLRLRSWLGSYIGLQDRFLLCRGYKLCTYSCPEHYLALPDENSAVWRLLWWKIKHSGCAVQDNSATEYWNTACKFKFSKGSVHTDYKNIFHHLPRVVSSQANSLVYVKGHCGAQNMEKWHLKNLRTVLEVPFIESMLMHHQIMNDCSQ